MKKKSADQSVSEVYTSFVDTFFSDTRSLVTGIVLQAVVVGAAWLDTGAVVYLVLLAAMLATAVLRLRQARAYRADRFNVAHLDLDERVEWSTEWEKRYVWLSAAGAALIGLYAFIALQIAPSEYSVVSSSILVFATIPTIVARIYGSDRLAVVIAISLLVPMALGLLLRFDISHTLVAFLCIPYLFLVRSLVRGVRSSVLGAIQERWMHQAVAERFDVALNNMSHGLIMFDGDRRVLVANRAARTLFDVPKDVTLEGRRFETLLRYAKRRGVVTRSLAAKFRKTLVPMIMEGGSNKRFTLPSGRTLEFTANPRAASGAVLTFEDITERIRAEKKMVNMARFDALTGLSNRSYFATLIAERLRHKEETGKCVLFMLDIDDFKHVNDTLGHSQGDALLRAVAARLKAFRRATTMISRQGGDEFMVFIPTLGKENAGEVAEALRQDLTGIYELGDEQVHITTSIGAAVSDQSDFDLTRMMMKADLALYRSKAQGKGMCSTFEESMDEEYRQRQLLKNELAKAIDEESLTVRYQPIVDASTGRLVACEALSRWSHPELGNVSPGEYIPLAEEMGIIGKLSRSVLKTAMRDCAEWPEDVSVSINLSALDFRRRRLMDEIEQALKESGLKPERVEIEVTETAVISNEQEMLASLDAIRKRGMRISLDDFGTGYSSLSYLHRLPLDKVKIDRSFVEGIENGSTPLSMLRGIAGLCKTLGLQVTIEGVSSVGQLNLVLATEGVNRIQGFVLGPALPPSSIKELACRTLLKPRNSEEAEVRELIS